MLISHEKFLLTVIQASRLYSSVYTAIPTFIFLTFFFSLLYQHVLQSTNYYTRWQTQILRNVKFHWIYFNGTRLWFVVLSCFRKVTVYADNYIDESLPEKSRNFNKMVTQATCLFVVSSLALLPLLLIYLNHLYKNDMPNFLMWVMEDPWVRHEIGISGHCLERPLRIDVQKLKNCSYRSHRSNSFDTQPWINVKGPLMCRACQSMIERHVVKSPDDLIK